MTNFVNHSMRSLCIIHVSKKGISSALLHFSRKEFVFYLEELFRFAAVCIQFAILSTILHGTIHRLHNDDSTLQKKTNKQKQINK